MAKKEEILASIPGNIYTETDTPFIQDFKATLRAGVPLVCVQTNDPASVVHQILSITKEKTDNKDAPLVSWDIAGGLKVYNEAGKEALKQMMEGLPAATTPDKITDPIGAAKLFKKLPRKGIMLVLNAHRILHSRNLMPEAVVGQEFWNLRDEYKSSRRTLVLVTPQIQLPPELVNDVLILDEPLPTTKELRDKVVEMYGAADLKLPEERIVCKAVEHVRGLSLFAAEQAIAMSFTRSGLDLRRLFMRKKNQVEQTPGLSVYTDVYAFKDLEGVQAVKEYTRMLFTGRDAPTAIIFIDEIEKMLAGIHGDLSGVSQDQHQEFLRWTQNHEVLATMWVGHPGCSKSFTAKCCAGEFEVPLIEMNFGAMKGGIIGQSGAQTREALRMASALGRPLLIGTSNKLSILPAELKRRFKQGTWFFDLPDLSERAAVWALYMRKYEIRDTDIPVSDGWTPDEIETCCRNAWRFGISLNQARKYVVPLIEQDPEAIKKLRLEANRHFLSASKGGQYIYTELAINEQAIREMQIKGVAQA